MMLLLLLLVYLIPVIIAYALTVDRRVEIPARTGSADEAGDEEEDAPEEVDRKKWPKFLEWRYSAESFQCEKCHKWPKWEETPHKCAACGLFLCKNCYHAGFCKKHFYQLEKDDRARVERLARTGKALIAWLILGLMAFVIITLILGFSLSALHIPWELFEGIIIAITSGGSAFSIWAVWMWERSLRARFWGIVMNYDFDETGGTCGDQGEEEEEEEEKEGTSAGTPAESPVKACGNCGWILTADKTTCPRCGCPNAKS